MDLDNYFIKAQHPTIKRFNSRKWRCENSAVIFEAVSEDGGKKRAKILQLRKKFAGYNFNLRFTARRVFSAVMSVKLAGVPHFFLRYN